jgi:hypothetical protein
MAKYDENETGNDLLMTWKMLVTISELLVTMKPMVNNFLKFFIEKIFLDGIVCYRYRNRYRQKIMVSVSESKLADIQSLFSSLYYVLI